MGHPVLQRRAEPATDPRRPEIRRLIADMKDTLADIGGAGLAAPQVHAPLRIAIFEAPAERGGEDPAASAGLTVLVDPEIEPLGTETETDWEACLSVPGLRGAVRRPARIRYRGLGAEGETVEREAAGFHARVVQHECDHLDGILYPMRMADISSLHFVSEIGRNPRWRGAPGAE